MIVLVRGAAGLLLAWVAVGPLACGETRQSLRKDPPTKLSSSKPAISIHRLGSVELEGRRRVVLADALTDLAGEAWDYAPDDRFLALLRRLGQASWTVAAESEAAPGGLFEISGLRFPAVGEFELVAGIFPAGALAAGGQVPEDRLRTLARVLSRRLFVRVTGSPPVILDERRPALSILTVGGKGVDLNEPAAVPAGGDVVVHAQSLFPGSQIYLALLVPYSDRGYLHGPASQGTEKGTYVFQGVSFDVPGDPRQAHLELIALASAEPLSAGPTSFQSVWRRHVLTSPTIHVMVDEKEPATHSQRVPHLAITRIGPHALGEGEAPDRPLPLEPGRPIEISRYERATDESQVWILTRPRGSTLWLAQGPALLRGSPAGDDPLDWPPAVTWIWPSLRFEHPVEAATASRQGGRQTREEFEVLAVLSRATLPNAWVDSAALASVFIQSVSQLIAVSVRPSEPLSKPAVTISRVGDEDADPEDETAVGAVERVEVSVREELPPALRVYVAWHLLDSSRWSLTETLPQGKTHVVPALSFGDRQVVEGTRYQLLAIVTPGILPVEQLDFKDLVHVAVASSEAVTVRHVAAGLGGFFSRLTRSRGEGTPNSPNPVAEVNEGELERPALWPLGRKLMSWIGSLLFFLFPLVLILGGLFLLRWLGRSLGNPAPLARRAADRVERSLLASREWFSPLPKINPAHFLLGILLLGFLLYAIGRYLPLYAQAIAVVTGLSPKESAGLALWLVLVTAFSGIFLELTFDDKVFSRDGEGLGWLKLLLGVSLFVLMVFQASFYYTFLKHTVGETEGTPALGGVAFFLIASVEAISFFFITRLSLVPAGAMAVRLGHAPFVVAGLLLRALEKWFDKASSRRPEEVKPPSTAATLGP